MKLFDAFSTKDQVDGHFFQTFSQNMEKMAIFYIFTYISFLKWGSFDFISLVKLTLLQTSRVPGYMSMQWCGQCPAMQCWLFWQYSEQNGTGYRKRPTDWLKVYAMHRQKGEKASLQKYYLRIEIYIFWFTNGGNLFYVTLTLYG